MEEALPGNVVGSGVEIRKGKVLILTVSLNPKNLLMNESIPYFAVIQSVLYPRLMKDGKSPKF